MMDMLFETELIGGLAGDALKSVGDSIATGIINGAKYVLIGTAIIVEKLSGVAVLGSEAVYFTSKSGSDKGKIIKYFLIYAGAVLVEVLANAW